VSLPKIPSFFVYKSLRTITRLRQTIANVGFEPQTTSRSCDFELKNGSGFYLQGFIAGASYGYLEILLCNTLCYILETLSFRKCLLYKRLCKSGPAQRNMSQTGSGTALPCSTTGYEKAVRYLDIYANITLLYRLNCRGSPFLRKANYPYPEVVKRLLRLSFICH
jgi:hypothetical protein